MEKTILVVEDNISVLNTVTKFLQNGHFNVLSCHNALDALVVASKFSGKIDLLLSDIEMLNLTGPELAEQIKEIRPDIHVMFMSGMVGGNLLVLNYGWAFIEKPFVATKLIEMVTIVLTSANRSQDAYQYDTRADEASNEKIRIQAKAEGKAEAIEEDRLAREEAQVFRKNGLLTKDDARST